MTNQNFASRNGTIELCWGKAGSIKTERQRPGTQAGTFVRTNLRFGYAPRKGGAFRRVQVLPGKPRQPEATGAVMEETKWLKPSV
jgi:hypothetical protein